MATPQRRPAPAAARSPVQTAAPSTAPSTAQNPSPGGAQDGGETPAQRPAQLTGLRRVQGVEFLKKIAPRLVMETDIEKPEHARDLYTVLGTATGVKTGATNYGPWVAVTGTFEVIRVHDGKKFLSGTAFLPEPYNGMLAATVMAQLQPDPETGEVIPPAVKFAVIVGIKPSPVPIGYEYTAKPLVEAAQADALADLREAVAGLLPAPVSA